MKRLPNSYSLKRAIRLQSGVALLTVLIILLLSSILVLGAFRVGYINELLVGTESDHNRARAAAEALIRDAEMDIRGRRPPYDKLQANFHRGIPCRPKTTAATELRVEDNYRTYTDETEIGGCRARQVALTPYIPENLFAYDGVKSIVLANQISQGTTLPCSQGICTPATLTTLGDFHTNLTDDMLDQGAVYGQYTRQALSALTVESNALLAPPAAGTANRNASGWYWIEIFLMPANKEAEKVNAPGTTADPRDKYTPIKDHELVYRITAIVKGRKSGTQVVLKSLFIPFPKYQN